MRECGRAKRLSFWTFFGMGALGLLGACSKVDFVSLPPASCVAMNMAHGGNACSSGPAGQQVYDYTVTTGDVDILFINDNSGSMEVEQRKMADKFPGFLNLISHLSYQIAVTSTDVSKGGPGQDGRFFSFGDGSSVLKNFGTRDGSHDQLFQNTIQRPETLDCPNGPSCPSGDERGIYAAIRSLERAENRDFFRAGSHLAIVVLSDEDERSSGGGAPGSEMNGGAISSGYRYTEYDMPETLVTKAKEILPPTTSFSVHSIIIRPKASVQAADTSCFVAQNSQGGGVRGYYGTQYARLSQPNPSLLGLGPIKAGTLGDICSTNYTNELNQIAQHLRTSSLQLPCRPISGTFRVEYLDSVPANQTEFLDSSNQVHFSPSVEGGVKIRLQFSCT